MIAISVVASTAAAQEPIEPEPVELPGWDVEMTVDWLVIRSPDLPIPSLPVESPIGDLPVGTQPIERVNTCVVDDDLHEEDLVACELADQMDVKSPCDYLVRQVGAVPVVGETVSSAVQGVIDSVDDTMAQEVMPLLDDNGFNNTSWDSETDRAVNQCQGEVRSVRTTTGVGDGGIGITINDPPPICPPIGPDEYPFCSQLELQQQLEAPLEGNKTPVVTRDCSFDGLLVDCGNFTAGEEELNPFAPSNELLEQLPDEGHVSYSFNQTDQETPRVGAFSYVVPFQSTARCDTPGNPSSEGEATLGGLPLALDVTVTRNGGNIAGLGLERVLENLLLTTAGAVNSTSDTLAQNWNMANGMFVDMFNKFWQEGVLYNPVTGEETAVPGWPGFPEGSEREELECQQNEPTVPSPPSVEP